jgi:hypothetical protein
MWSDERIDRQTDGHNAANRCFSGLCKPASKSNNFRALDIGKINQSNYPSAHPSIYIYIYNALWKRGYRCGDNIKMDLTELSCHFWDGLDRITLWYNQKNGFCERCDELYNSELKLSLQLFNSFVRT